MVVAESPAAEMNKAGAVQAGAGGGGAAMGKGGWGGPWAPVPQGRLLRLAGRTGRGTGAGTSGGWGWGGEWGGGTRSLSSYFLGSQGKARVFSGA